MLNDSTVADVEFDEYAELDAEAYTKEIKKWKKYQEISYQKKVEKLEEAKKKTEENKKKRLALQPAN